MDGTEKQRSDKHAPAFEEALCLLAEIQRIVQTHLPGLADDPRHLRLAKDVLGVFEVYEDRLLALRRDFGVAPDRPGLTTRELGFVRLLVRSAKNARTSLDHVEGDASLALDRAFAAGECRGSHGTAYRQSAEPTGAQVSRDGERALVA